MWPRFKPWLADRTLRRAARVVDPEQLRRAFALASEQGRLAYQGTLNQHAGHRRLVRPEVDGRRVATAAGIDNPDRRSIEWPGH